MLGSELFLLRKPNILKFEQYGFVRTGDHYVLKKEIAEGQFSLKVSVYDDCTIRSELTDLGSDEEYILHLIEGASGGFVGKIREEYLRILEDISEKCFDKLRFRSSVANNVIGYVYEQYGILPEFLWDKNPDNAIWRRPDNGKWFGALLSVSASRLGFPVDEKIEILNLTAMPDVIDNLVDNLRYFRGYHMNKKHWFSICLDGSVETDTIRRMIDESYHLVSKKHK